MKSGDGRRGLSLLEVIVSTAIFVAAIAVIGELLDDGLRQVEVDRLATIALLRCESKMEEIVAGLQSIDQAAADPLPFTDDPRWKWTVIANPTDVEGLLRVSVLVSFSESMELNDEPPLFEESLTRLVPEPPSEARPTPSGEVTGSITIPEMLGLNDRQEPTP